MYDDLLQEWTMQSTDGQPVTLTFNSFDVGTPLPAPSTETSYIWTPNYPNDYPKDYQQVKLSTSFNCEHFKMIYLGMETRVNDWGTYHTHFHSI